MQYQHNLYIAEKYIYRLQFFHRHYGFIFIRLTVVPTKILKSREITIKFDLIAVQGHPRLLVLVSIETSYSQLVINSNVGRISYSFRDIEV